MLDKILFAKVHQDAIIPTKRDEDGCYDLRACFEAYEMEIKPDEIKLIPTGICSSFDSKYRISLRERGTNTRHGLAVRALLH